MRRGHYTLSPFNRPVCPKFTPRITALPVQAFLLFRLSFQIRSPRTRIHSSHHCLTLPGISALQVIVSDPLGTPQFTPRITALPIQAFLPFRLSFQIRSHHAYSSCNQWAMSKKGGRSATLRRGWETPLGRVSVKSGVSQSPVGSWT